MSSLHRPSVPVTMGSPRFTTVDAAPFRLSHAWFPPGEMLEPHTHDEATFAVMLRGSFQLVFTGATTRRRELDCPPGTILTEPAGEAHYNQIGTAGAEVVVLQMDPSGSDPALQPFRPLLIDRINHFRHAGIGLQARRLAHEITRPDAFSPLAVEALALDILVLASRDRGRAVRGDAPAWLRRAEDYLREHFRESLRVGDVAEAVGVHPAHLASVFRARHRVPLGEFVRRLRVDWAAVRLEETDDALSSIAFAAGFADQSHLSRTFKKYMGISPGAYRRKAR